VATNVASPQPGRALAWAGDHVAPLVLLPLAAILVWVAIWKIWLPQPPTSAQVVRTVTTSATPSASPKRTVKTVTKSTSPSVPSRRSETLVIALLLLGAACAMVGVFSRRIASIELGKDGVKITLTKAEQAGLGRLVTTLQGSGASSATMAAGVQRYLGAVAAQRAVARASSPRKTRSVAPEHAELLERAGVVAPTSGLTEQQAADLADAIAADLV
jgi:hypothetical protein